MVDFAIQRLNMVESQVRPSDVTDRRIMRAMQNIAREQFVPEDVRAVAYADSDLPFTITPADGGPAAGFLLAPRVFAKMVQALEIGSGNVVLDVACGTGYSTAVLSQLAQTVVAIDQHDSMVDFATRALADCGVDNAVVVHKDLKAGYPEEGPYDAVIINGLVAEVPDTILDQLKDGGRLVTIEGAAGIGAGVQWRRLGGTFDRRWLFDAGAPRLPAFERKQEFAF